MTSDELCGATTRNDGHACKNRPLRGATRCKFHGGASPQARRRAEQRLTEADAFKALAKTGATPVESPIRELARLGGEVLLIKDFLVDRLGAGSPKAGDLAAVATWLDRCERILSILARLNIEERAMALSQRDAAIVVESMSRFAALLGHDVAEPSIRVLVVEALTAAQNSAALREKQLSR